MARSPGARIPPAPAASCASSTSASSRRASKARCRPAFEYSDGMGSVLVKKVQAEPEAPGKPLRWVASGKTILNNKGKPVKQYEPYFSRPIRAIASRSRSEEGVTPVIYYDAVGRTVRTEMPDGTLQPGRVLALACPHVRPERHGARSRATPGSRGKTAATGDRTGGSSAPRSWRREHADTPALTILDSLGREVIAIAHNRVERRRRRADKTKNTSPSPSSMPRASRCGFAMPARICVMQYITPPVPNDQLADPSHRLRALLRHRRQSALPAQHGCRRPLDAQRRRRQADAGLGRPGPYVPHRIRRAAPPDPPRLSRGAIRSMPNRVIQFEKMIYGDTPGKRPGRSRMTTQLNLRGKPYRHHDTAGIVVT